MAVVSVSITVSLTPMFFGLLVVKYAASALASQMTSMMVSKVTSLRRVSGILFCSRGCWHRLFSSAFPCAGRVCPCIGVPGISLSLALLSFLGAMGASMHVLFSRGGVLGVLLLFVKAYAPLLSASHSFLSGVSGITVPERGSVLDCRGVASIGGVARGCGCDGALGSLIVLIWRLGFFLKGRR